MIHNFKKTPKIIQHNFSNVTICHQQSEYFLGIDKQTHLYTNKTIQYDYLFSTFITY